MSLDSCHDDVSVTFEAVVGGPNEGHKNLFSLPP